MGRAAVVYVYREKAFSGQTRVETIVVSLRYGCFYISVGKISGKEVLLHIVSSREDSGRRRARSEAEFKGRSLKRRCSAPIAYYAQNWSVAYAHEESVQQAGLPLISA